MKLCLLLVVFLLGPSYLWAESPARYSNEFPGYRFYPAAVWRKLTPLVSTMADVRKVLGDPAEVSEDYGLVPYPGDAAAKRPLFIYEADANWRMYVYFAGTRGDHPELQTILHDRLFSIEYLPREPLHFGFDISRPFVRKEVMGADARWNEYADGSGLTYSVYTGPTPYGKVKAGDLQRSSMGLPQPK